MTKKCEKYVFSHANFCKKLKNCSKISKIKKLKIQKIYKKRMRNKPFLSFFDFLKKFFTCFWLQKSCFTKKCKKSKMAYFPILLVF